MSGILTSPRSRRTSSYSSQKRRSPATPRSPAMRTERSPLARSLSIKVLSTSKRKVTRRLGDVSLMPFLRSRTIRRSDRDEDVLQHAAGNRRLHRFMERSQRVRLGNERLDVEPAVGDRRDRLRVAVRPEVAAVDVQLFSVADDRPVDRRRFIENAELDERAELTDHLQPQRHRGWVARRLDEDVAAVAIRDVLHSLHGVLFGDVDAHVSTHLAGDIQPVVLGIESDQSTRLKELGDLEHAEADVPDAGDHDRVALRDLPPLDRMPGAGRWLDIRGLGGRERFRHLVHDRLGGVEGIFRHPSDKEALEAEDGVNLTHPVLPVLAKPALATGDDLFGDHAVSELDAVSFSRALAQSHDVTGKLMAGDRGWLAVTALAVAAPEEFAAQPALHVGCADTTGINFDEHFARTRRGNWDLFNAIVTRSVRSYDGHGLVNHGFPSRLKGSFAPFQFSSTKAYRTETGTQK